MSSALPGRLGGLAATAAEVAAVLVPASSASAAIMDTHLAFTGGHDLDDGCHLQGDRRRRQHDGDRPRSSRRCRRRRRMRRGAGPTGCIQLSLTRSDTPGRNASGTVNTYTFFTGTFTGLTPGTRVTTGSSTTQVTTDGYAPGTFKTARGGNTTYTAATYGGDSTPTTATTSSRSAPAGRATTRCRASSVCRRPTEGVVWTRTPARRSSSPPATT